MGERGPMPQPKAPKQKKPAPKNTRKVPAPPEDLPESLLESWTTFWESSVASLIQDAEMGLVTRLFDMYAQYAKAADVVAQALVVKGSTGQLRVNPLADHMLKLGTAILRLENELGLTPMARARLGIVEVPDAKGFDFIDELARKREATGA